MCRIKCYLAILVAALFATIATAKDVELAKPTPQQIRFADWEMGAFIHYDLNVFTGQEHGDGQEPPSKFNPTELDVEQWVKTAKAMGARYICLTARHEGGFCLWPSKTTDYTIANSPYKNGKGDIVREFVDACRKYDIVPAFYHTAAFDANATLGSNYKGPYELPLKWGSTWGKAQAEVRQAHPELKEQVKQKQMEQMRELLTNYGPIGFMWSDHWDATDPDGVWRAVTDLARELQPDMVFMGPDTWVPGNETGHVVYPMWNAVNTADGTNYSRPKATEKSDVSVSNNYGLLETDVLTGHPYGKFWRVRECTTNSGFSYGGWFWHPANVVKTYPKELWEHIDLYYRTVGLGANTIINLPPDNRGLIPDDIAKAAVALGKDLKKRFSNPIASLKQVTKGDVVELSWKKPCEINTIVTMENIANGQKIKRYMLEAWVGNKWVELEPQNRLTAAKPYNRRPGYETIGHKKIDRVSLVKTNKIRFRVVEAIAKPVEIRSIEVFKCDPIVRTFKDKYPYLCGVETLDEVSHRQVFRNMNYVGKEVMLGGKTYPHSLMLCPVKDEKHAYAEFDLKSMKQKVSGVRATIGIEDFTGDKGSSHFIVQGYSNGEWKELYNSGIVRGSTEPKAIEVIFPKGLERIRLFNSDGGDNLWNDHAVWGDAHFF